MRLSKGHINVCVWDYEKANYKFNKSFDKNPFYRFSDIERHLVDNGCRVGDEYYVINGSIDTHKVIKKPK